MTLVISKTKTMLLASIVLKHASQRHHRSWCINVMQRTTASTGSTATTTITPTPATVGLTSMYFYFCYSSTWGPSLRQPRGDESWAWRGFIGVSAWRREGIGKKCLRTQWMHTWNGRAQSQASRHHHFDIERIGQKKYCFDTFWDRRNALFWLNCRIPFARSNCLVKWLGHTMLKKKVPQLL